MYWEYKFARTFADRVAKKQAFYRGIGLPKKLDEIKAFENPKKEASRYVKSWAFNMPPRIMILCSFDETTDPPLMYFLDIITL